MYEISKSFDFDFGHRVWSQNLDEKYALTTKCKCRFLHGHSGKVVIHLTASKLTDGMVTDFNNLAWLKKFIDDNIDHKFIIDKNDPLFGTITLATDYADGTVGEQVIDKVLSKEYYESFYVIDFVPTSENLAKWMFDLVQEKMAPLGVKVSKVEWWETPKSRSVYGV